MTGGDDWRARVLGHVIACGLAFVLVVLAGFLGALVLLLVEWCRS